MTPSFIKVLLDGQDVETLAPFLLTLDCTISHQLNRHSTCRVQFREPPSSRFFFEPQIGVVMELKAVDADGAELPLFKGVLQEAAADWELNGSAVLTLSGVSKSMALDTFRNSQTFNEVPLSEAIKRLLGPRAADQVMPDPGPLSMIQFDETDWSFAHRLTDRFGGFMRISGDDVDVFDVFQGAGVELAWRTEAGLHAFRTRGRLEPTMLTGVNFEFVSATSEQTDALESDVAAEDSVPELRAGAIAGSKKLGLESAVWNKFLAPSHARFKRELSLEAERRIMSTCRGFGESRVPEIVVGEKVKITGAIDVPGTYGVIKIEHSWKPGRGYRNEFECTPFTRFMEPVAPPVERYYGPEIARVAETSPDQQGRSPHVRVNFLWADKNDTGFLPLITPNAGADRGICFVPEVGDQVLVFFRGGDACKPIVMGSMWNGVDQPPLEDLHGGEYKPNDIKRIVTKSGNRLVFDDKPGKETMVMATPNHVRVSLFDGGQTLLLHSDGDVHIHAGGTVHMRCKQFLREVG